jgi:sugar lactone lactonase YvrE
LDAGPTTIKIMPYDMEQVTGPIAFHAEGPVWHPAWGGLRWVDVFAGDVLHLDEASGAVTRAHVGEIVAAVRPRAGGGMVAGIERGFALVEPDGSVQRLPELWDGGPNRMNEGACDPQGRFYCGSLSAEPEAAALYRLDPDGTMTTALGRVTVSNGLSWAPDGETVYHVDTAKQEVGVFDYSPSAGLTGRRVAVRVPPEVGKPDGLAIDSDGGIWVAIYGGSAVHRYTPAGDLDEVVHVPCSHVTAVTFGGPDLQQLYITTSRENLPEGAEPNAGSVYRTRAGVTGQPTNVFAG